MADLLERLRAGNKPVVQPETAAPAESTYATPAEPEQSGLLSRIQSQNREFYNRKEGGFLETSWDFITQSADEFVRFGPRWWKSQDNINAEIEKTINKHGYGVGAKLWWLGTRSTLSQFGVPDTSDEEKLEMARILGMVNEGGSEEMVNKMDRYLKDTFAKGGLKDEEYQAALRGGLDWLLLPAMVAGPTGPALGAGLKGGFGAVLKEGTKRQLAKKMLAIEMHSISTAVAYEAGRAAIEDREVGKAALQGALFGAIAPAALIGGARVGGAALRGTGLAAGKTAQAILKTGAKTAQYAKRKVTPVVEGYIRRDAGRYAAAQDLQSWWNRQVADKFMTGASVLQKHGLGDLTQQLVAVRYKMKFRSGVWAARSHEIMSGMSKGEKKLMHDLLHKESAEWDDFLAHGGYDEKIASKLLERTMMMKNLLREVAEEAEKAGVAMDWGDDSLRFFVARKDFGMPHIIVDTVQYLPEGNAFNGVEGKLHKQAVAAIRNTDSNITEKRAIEILEEIHQQNSKFIKEADYAGFGSVNLRGRQYNLPGYVDDPGEVLPQYFANMGQKIEQTKAFRPEGMMDAIQELNPETGELERAFLMKRGFEHQYPAVAKMLEAVPDEKNRKLVTEIVKKQLGFVEMGTESPQILNKIAQWQVIMKLGLAQFTQMTQFGAATIQTGYRGAFKDLIRTFRDPEAYRFALKSGAILDSTIREAEMALMAGGSQAAQKTLQKIGFTYMDIRARIYGAIRGASMAQHAGKDMGKLLKKTGELDLRRLGLSKETIGVLRGAKNSGDIREILLEQPVFKTLRDVLDAADVPLRQKLPKGVLTSGHEQAMGQGFEQAVQDVSTALKKSLSKADAKSLKKLEKKFIELDLDPESIALRGGELTEEEIMKAGLKISSDVNFFGDALSLPNFWKSPTGRFLTQFKSFSYQQSVFMKRAVLDPLYKDGDAEPLMRALGAMGVTGELVSDAKHLLKWKERDEKGFDRVMDNILAGGGFGIAYDAIRASQFQNGLVNLALGPTIGDVSLGVQGLAQAGMGHPKLLAERAAHTIVPVGAQALPGGQTWGPVFSQWLVQRIKEM